ncbi:MAG: phosphatidate cytidylyltransferase [Phycisphaerae bacterium]|nr:phosphatidate cytidylyltransferase [Phycisphaerae bacterium]
MLRDRLLYGALLIALVVGLLWADEKLGAVRVGQVVLPPGLPMLALCLAAMAPASVEFARMFERKGVSVCAPVLYGCGATGLLSVWLAPTLSQARGPELVAAAGAVAIAGAALAHLRARKPEGFLGAIGAASAAFIYLGLLAGFVLALRRDFSAWTVLAVILITKACDSGAYFTGRSLGRHKLIAWLSPGKTWEGLVGGLAWGAGAAALFANGEEFLPGLSIADAAVFGAGLGLCGQAGDLFASAIKRDSGLKDSSSILPGFGGVMDMIDSPLWVAPCAFWVLSICGNPAAP